MTNSAAEPTALIRAQGLTKVFGARSAVAGIDFEVRDGEFFGFLGPNGAGKTTTMRMIAGVSPRTSGTLEIFGQDPDLHGSEIRGQIGVVHQQETLDMELTVRENLLIFGRFFGMERAAIATRADELLELFQLSDRAKDQVEPLSGGMKRRLSIARSLIASPRILMLDEPTTGLDPQARHLLWDALQRLKRGGTTIVLTTHYMDEAEQLCDRLVVMDQAKIVAEGSPRQLIVEHASREVLELRFPNGTESIDVKVLEGIGDRYERLAERVIIGCENGEAAHARALEHGLDPESWLVRRSSLEDVFLRLTGRTLDE
ncbi:MAG: ABC transporter ATP-binding protein [Chloroflexi bacterium]|jgi:lipooligosaccharide transport system ATP-binding protein|nr:ABC transporter ATP-binding protein [Chloroflexota bacterium]